MALPQTSLGQAVEVVRAFLSSELQSRGQPTRVDVGNLADNAPASASDPSRVNLLVTRIESDGSVAGIDHPWNPWLVRLHLLVTALTTDASPSVGQNDLRLLGEVMAVFHQHPILDVSLIEGVPVRLNVIPENISLEALNQLWAIQGEVGFRSSLAYEVSLVPIRTDLEQPDAFVVGRAVVPAGITTSASGTETGGAGHADLVLFGGETPGFHGVARSEVAALEVRVWVISEVDPVRLVWELLETSSRWQRVAPSSGLSSVATHTVDVAPDPEAAVTVDIPASADLPAGGPYQLVLRAIPEGADLLARALPGRPVVLSVFEP